MASPRRQLAALFLFCVIDTLGFGILIPLVPYMAERFGTPPQFITPVLGSYSLCQLLAARMLAGVMAGNIAAAFAYASDVSAPERRAATLGLVGAAIGIGFTLGQPIGGLLAGKDAHTASFTAPAVVAACLSVCAILIVRFVLPESHTAAHRALHPDSPRRGAWQLLRERPALALLAGSTLAVTYSQSILESIFAIWALGRFGFGPRTVGFLLFGIALPALLMQGGDR